MNRKYTIAFAVPLILMVGCSRNTPTVADSFIHCRSLAGDRTAVKVLQWKFDAITAALQEHCPPNEELPIDEMVRQVVRKMSPELRDSLGDARADVRTVLLELEVRRWCVRAPGVDGQADVVMLRWTGSPAG